MTTSVLIWETSPVLADARPRQREIGFDAARLVASIAIVWAHTPRGSTLDWLSPLGSFGTCFFTGASIYFMTRSLRADPGRSFSAYAESRFRRLYLPFLAWSALYLAFRDVCRHFISHQPVVNLRPMTLMSGGEMHLWFLPFVLVVGLIALPIVRIAMGSAQTARSAAALCALTGAALIIAVPPKFAPESDTVNFYRCAWYALPSAFWGIALALSPDLLSWLRSRAPWTTLAAASLTVAALVSGVTEGVSVAEKNIAGTAWLLSALSLPPIPALRRLGAIVPLAFGLYLVHPFVLGCLNTAIRLAHLPRSAPVEISCFVSAVVVGLAMAWCIRRSRALQWLIP